MSEIGKHKLSDALDPHHPGGNAESGKPVPTHATDTEQAREAEESQKAKDAEASIRDRMVDIGRGNQQAGRQGS